MINHQEKKLVQRIKGVLDEGNRIIDPRIEQHLTQARRNALNQLPSKRKNSGVFGKWQVIGGVAMACTVIISVLTFQPSSSLTIPEEINLETLSELEIISSSEPLELYEELDFYEWLEGQNAV